MQNTIQNKSTFKFGIITMFLLTILFVSACTSKSSKTQDESQPHTDDTHEDGAEHHEGDEH
ncbi:MAG: hypothetical protein M3Q44_00130 [bacterium]|nr:hypothetical protein [bacterium]